MSSAFILLVHRVLVTGRPSFSPRLAIRYETHVHPWKKNNLDQRPACLMEESLSITETLELLDPSRSPALEIPHNTMKRRNPYLIKFPLLRLSRYLNSISRKCRTTFFSLSLFFTLNNSIILSEVFVLALFNLRKMVYPFTLFFSSGYGILYAYYANITADVSTHRSTSC